MYVYLVRHAVAHSRNSERWPDDSKRPLTPEGEEEFVGAARGLARIVPEVDGAIEVKIPRSEIDYYASRLLSVGTDVFVESPPELVEAIENKAREIVCLYRPQPS